jgi:hypothetical protein
VHATLLSETGRVLEYMLLCCQIRYRSIGPAEIATWGEGSEAKTKHEPVRLCEMCRCCERQRAKAGG